MSTNTTDESLSQKVTGGGGGGVVVELNANSNKHNMSPPTVKKEYLAAPPTSKSRRVRSNSPSYFNPKSIIKSKSNMDNNNHNQLLSPHSAKLESSTKSIESTNSTFSAGFLPSPDVQTPSNQSSMIGFNSNNNNTDNKTSPSHGGRLANSSGSLGIGTVALVAATIGSSIMLTQEQQELLQQHIEQQKKPPAYAERASFKSNFLSAFAQAAAKKLTTSSSLMPVKTAAQPIFLLIQKKWVLLKFLIPILK
jgi:hypothetical protein